MNQLLNWLDMGGYSFYVWSAYGLVLTVFSLEVITLLKHRRKTMKQLEKWLNQP